MALPVLGWASSFWGAFLEGDAWGFGYFCGLRVMGNPHGRAPTMEVLPLGRTPLLSAAPQHLAEAGIWP